MSLPVPAPFGPRQRALVLGCVALLGNLSPLNVSPTWVHHDRAHVGGHHVSLGFMSRTSSPCVDTPPTSPLPGHRRRPGSIRAYPMPDSDPGLAPSPHGVLQAARNGMRRVVRGRWDGPSGRMVTNMFDRCRDTVTAAGERRRTCPCDRATSCVGGGGMPRRPAAPRRHGHLVAYSSRR
jgi:hypothetical protein